MKNLYFLIAMLFLAGCQSKEEEKTASSPLFTGLPAEETGIRFSNDLVVNDSVNFFKYGYYYMGGGVATGDINGDGLADLYFTANRVQNALYLNQGNLNFEEVTAESGVAGTDQWITGVAFSDVNNDGKLDIYVSVAGIWASTKNLLYVNQGNNEKGIPIFKEEAELRGVADAGMSIQSAFLDYDKDGDLDLYVANYEKTSFGTLIQGYKSKVDNPVHASSDHLYENDGEGNFTDVTEKAGILNFGLAVGVLASDFNQDGLTDIYVSNDFNTPDFFYFNNGDGTFTDQIKSTTMHTAFYGMGVDAADFNNDGKLDLVQVDMTPADNFRSKANMASMDIDGFWENVEAGFHYQYMYNALQMNNGLSPEGYPYFSDIAKISGLDKTDWSWASLFADFDNDGLEDLFITNGTRRDINNKDFFKWMGRLDIKMKIKYKSLSFTELTEKMPAKKVDNYMFRNTNGMQFEKQNKEWGIAFEGYSNGAAYADLDNDGDLDLVINNIDSAASIFRNNAESRKENNFLSIQLQGAKQNPFGLGTKVWTYHSGIQQYKEQTLVRGYQSSVDPVLHFGLGKSTSLDSVVVLWPDGKREVQKNVVGNTRLVLQYEAAKEIKLPKAKGKTVFKEIKLAGLDSFHHQENDFNDYDYQILLPHRMSRLGPAIAVGDVNGDGIEEVFLGGAAGFADALWSQKEGVFTISPFKDNTEMHETVAAQFFDADNDGDLDLYIVSGGNDHALDDPAYQDRLYLNTEGRLKLAAVLPNFTISGGSVLPFDYDQDGDLDLFICGRQTPRQYPLPASSIVLENTLETGSLQFVASEQSAFTNLGMVTDAIAVDLDADAIPELVVVGEWMPITVFKLNKDLWENKTEDFNLSKTVGWWNTIEKGDFDQDGDLDLIVGNLGLNYKYQASPERSFDIYASDYDENGNIDIVLGYYQGETQFPVRGMQCSSQQMPEIKTKFKNKYNAFASASLQDIYSESQLQNGIHYKATHFQHVMIENTGKKELLITPLPIEVQTSSMNSMLIKDWDGNGTLDIVAGGNNFSSEVETPRNDASYGWLLIGDGKGGFKSVPNHQSGLYVPEDCKQVVQYQDANRTLVLFANNQGPLKVYSK